MKPNRGKITAAWVAICAAAVIVIAVTPGSAKNISRISDVLDLRKNSNIVAVLPDVPGFIGALREGDAARAFFDSPLGLHFLRSAPFRSTAHLHRLISLVPRSWQWNLYSLISDGPVYYQSHGKQFTLVIALNKKGKVITSILSESSAAKTEDWLVITSDKELLAEQVAYLGKPAATDSPLDAAATKKTSLSILFNRSPARSAKPSLTRALTDQLLSAAKDGYCTLSLTPGIESLAAEGECPAGTVTAANMPEKISIGNFPAYAWFRKTGQSAAHLLAFAGLTVDYGYLIPQVFYSGPAADQKSIEFLSQAFKTKSHLLESKDGAIQIRYPSPYAYQDRKFDLFAPHLSANRERFFWHSYLTGEKPGNQSITVTADLQSYLSVKIFPVIKNSEAALKQFDAIYSPGHFNEFRDALFKSLPALKKSSLTLFTKHTGTALKIGGALNFAEN
jgi:hypothetical protein